MPTRFAIVGAGVNGQFREDGTLGSDCSRFNFNPYNFYQTPQERYGATAIAHYDITDDHRVYTSAMFNNTQVTQQIAAHAVVGGVAAELAGGKFGHGFISAGVTKGAGGTFLKGGTNLSSGDIAKGTFISAAIGGTVSKLTGGKFANGASTGAFQYLFNQVTKSFRENALKTKREF